MSPLTWNLLKFRFDIYRQANLWLPQCHANRSLYSPL